LDISTTKEDSERVSTFLGEATFLPFRMASIFGIINEETPKFDLLKKAEAGYEIRRYHRQLQASVTYPDEGEGATTPSGFRDLAGYIFGGNKKRAKTDESDKIAMTAPVMTFSDPDKKATTMSFILPSKYQSIDELPIPNNSKVELEVVEPYTAAVLQFSGRWTPAATKTQLKRLLQLLKSDKEVKLTVDSDDKVQPKLARYNPPWTIPFFRTTEIIVPVVFTPSET
jgi:hypothetical protein